jgi:hypothetical protein
VLRPTCRKCRVAPARRPRFAPWRRCRTTDRGMRRGRLDVRSCAICSKQSSVAQSLDGVPSGGEPAYPRCEKASPLPSSLQPRKTSVNPAAARRPLRSINRLRKQPPVWPLSIQPRQ